MTGKNRRARRLPYLVRIVRARPRLFVSLLAGLAVAALLPSEWRYVTRILVGWDAAVWLYLASIYHLIAKASVSHIRKHAAMDDEGRWAILVLTVVAALATLAAIIAELGTGQGSGRQFGHLLLATLTILSSWAFIHFIFALHYAHEFYGEDGEKKSGLAFPGNEKPDYWDFVYFSFVIGMTSQVSDVAVTSRAIRHTVTAHGIVSFIFNAALLALTVNIAASAI
jgi:uncharacterized membrane protein